MSDTIQITPNVVVSNSDTRRRLGNVLWIISLVVGVFALFFAFFPEVAFGTDIPSRAIAFVNGVISLVTGAFGLVLVRPNTPRVGDAIPGAVVLNPLPGETREDYQERTGQ